MYSTKTKPKNLFTSATLSVASIKKLGAQKSDANLHTLLELFNQDDLDIDLKREIVSSIGRQKDNDKILAFLSQEAFKTHFMEVIYQMLRTCLYKAKTDPRFATLRDQILKHYDNEVMDKMLEFHQHRQQHKSPKRSTPQITQPSLLVGDNCLTLQQIQDQQIQLIFTSPPYYNARVYSDYANYQEYLKHMQETLEQCFRILEDGRFIVVNVSPVIIKRPGREFESRRYPIHFDFHTILSQSGFYFLDEIIWIKPEYSVPNRVAGYLQSKKPLSYKPNCITESLLVYRKNAPFLIDKNLKRYDKSHKNEGDTDSTNCWYIAPKSSKDHPAVFPEELCARVLKYYSFQGDIVCDPFAGSGTFGRVAQEMGRIPLLCEQNKEYAMRL
ncbi:Methyltransferase [Helicobacter heilmannii]|uniref:DNA-methyltransferase n=1 Tax=Helicobacter heilmannii TaxID=35817 RepID=UPI00244D80D2|nr:site-specific DNA-methyltransferase [Helicobacter heilmannii]GMB94695.1 Methyltransferase [Helicobacter heilmannii]